jgi:patatin-like phospholipase/acyl hydrolase
MEPQSEMRRPGREALNSAHDSVEVKENYQDMRSPSFQSEKRCLLSLDGGGVRGLASLATLDKMMRMIDPVNPPKPCEVFDMIGGTSTGGYVSQFISGRADIFADSLL